MKTLIIDTSFWIALYNPEKEIEKQELVELVINSIKNYQVLIPFPTLYEFLNSKFSRTQNSISFKQELSKFNYTKIDDSKYKDKALNNFFEQSQYTNKDVSFVDEIIKEMINDVDLKTDFIITFDTALENYALSKNVRMI